jgi:hypothetical protein
VLAGCGGARLGTRIGARATVMAGLLSLAAGIALLSLPRH